MSQPSSELNQTVNLQGSSNNGQIGQSVEGDVTQIQIDKLTFNQTQIIQISVAEIRIRTLNTTSPYRWLEHFDLKDKDYFFGRDQFLTELVNELEHTNLILLLGASGSGKSSVIRAGLVPWLAKRWGSQFVNLMLTPDHDPFESLYASLLGPCKQAEARIARECSADTLVKIVTTLKQPESYWFIFIDQFEELFTTSQPENRDLFIDSLVQLTKKPNPLVKVVATMRADFLDRLSPYPALVRATHKRRPMIAEMQMSELRLAIEQPAAHHGVVFEEGLVEEIIKDVQGQAGYLPLLQYTLSLLWNTEVKTGRIQDRVLQINTYRTLGGVTGALQKHVNDIYGKMSQQEKLATQTIFLRLVGIGGDEASETSWKPIRRRADRSEFSTALEKQVLIKLIKEKLLVSDRQPQTQQATVELAHETLLTSWATLNTWIKENRQAIALRNRLNDDVSRWQEKKSDDELWTGGKLEQVVELRQDQTFNQVLGGFSEAANQFINASVGLRDRRHRITLAAVVVILIFGGFGWIQWQQLQFNQFVSDIAFDTVTPITAKPIYERLSNILEKAEASRNKGNVDQALVYYRQLRVRTVRLLSQIKENPKFKEDPKLYSYFSKRESEIQSLSLEAETALAELIKHNRLRELEEDLQNKKIGTWSDNADFKGFENHFTEGALQTTYKILMRDFGAKADLNENGLLDSIDEARQIPCQTLKDIEYLWRNNTERQCGWYGKNLDYEDQNTNCKSSSGDGLLNGHTLTDSIFVMPYEGSILYRLKECKVASSKT